MKPIKNPSLWKSIPLWNFYNISLGLKKGHHFKRKKTKYILKTSLNSIGRVFFIETWLNALHYKVSSYSSPSHISLYWIIFFKKKYLGILIDFPSSSKNFHIFWHKSVTFFSTQTEILFLVNREISFCCICFKEKKLKEKESQKEAAFQRTKETTHIYILPPPL